MDYIQYMFNQEKKEVEKEKGQTVNIWADKKPFNCTAYTTWTCLLSRTFFINIIFFILYQKNLISVQFNEF